VKQKFNIDDRVMSLRTGFPQIGTIVGITKGSHFEKEATAATSWNASIWDKAYPNWRDKPIYGVILDIESCPMTREEFELMYTEDCPYNYDDAPKVDTWVFPEDDLQELI